jgi:hypothetical protein
MASSASLDKTIVQMCASSAPTKSIGTYYVCSTQPSPSCQPTLQQVAQQVWIPVASFSTDNNGVVFDIPEIPAGGAANVQGSLYFGLGTESNNQLEGATIYNFPLTAI